MISLTSELSGKRLEILQQLIPRISRVAIVRDLDNRGTRLYETDTTRAAKLLGIMVQVVGVHGRKDLDGAFLAMKQRRDDAVMFVENTAFVAHRQSSLIWRSRTGFR